MVDVKSDRYVIFEEYVKRFSLERKIIIQIYEFMAMCNITNILDMTQFQLDQLYILVYSNVDYPLHDFSCLRKIIYAYLNECHEGYSWYNPVKTNYLTS